MRKILFLSTCVRGGGAGWSLYTLLKHIDRRRFEFAVVLPAPGIFEALYQSLRIRLHPLPVLPERMSPGMASIRRAGDLRIAARRVARIAREEKFGLIYCNNMLTKPVGWLAGRMSGTPVVFHCRNIHDTLSRALFYPALARARWVRKVICNSLASKHPYDRLVSEKTVVVYNGVDLDRFKANRTSAEVRVKLGIDPGAPIVGYFGNLIPRKGPQVLLEAASILKEKSDAIAMFVGDEPVGSGGGFRRRLESRAGDLGVTERVRFVGAVPDIRPYLAQTSVAAIPSLQEPFGRVAIEAMAMDIPVVASAVGGLSEIVFPGETGLLVPPENPEALARAVLTLISDVPRAKRLARAARKSVEERFSAPVIARQVESILESI